MSKKRVYELAREVGLESKALIKKLNDIGIIVASHQSALEERQVLEFYSAFGKSSASVQQEVKRPVVRRRKKAVVTSPPKDSEKLAASPESSTEDKKSITGSQKVSVESTQVVLDPQQESESKDATPKTSIKIEESHDPKLDRDHETQTQDLSESGKEHSSKGKEELVSKESKESKDNSVETFKNLDHKSSEDPQVSKKNIVSSSEEKSTGSSGVEKETVRAKANQSSDNAQAPTKKSLGGATIVRRATQEESQALKLKESYRYKSKKDESHRGVSLSRPSHLRRKDPSHVVTEEKSKQISSASHPTATPNTGESSAFTGGKSDKKNRPLSDEAKLQRSFLKQKRHRSNSGSDALLAKDYSQAATRKKRVFSNIRQESRRKDFKNQKALKLKKTQITIPRQEYRIVKMENDTISVSALAMQLNVKSAELIKKLMQQGVMVTVNQEIDFDTVTLIANEYNYECKSVKRTVEDILKDQEAVASSDLKSRPPIITVMGHVDHGKTSILDAIRKTGVADKEAGGITQHIGAYMVELKGEKLTFLDTPGHEAFSAMRSRGAQLTDLVILVVAADDGVMPQTIEAIAHAKASNVPVVVAVNKIDKENINLDRVYSELSEQGLQSESWGGDTQFVHVSALKKEGLDELLEAVQLQAEVLDLKATEKASAKGIVVEAHLDKGRGVVATVIVTRGILNTGDFIVVGSATGRVRAMVDHNGKRLKKAYPSMPVEIVGLNSIPLAADTLNVVADDKTAREVSDLRTSGKMESQVASSSSQSLDELLNKVQADNIPQISVLLKADTQGSVEAINDAISKLGNEQVTAKVVYKGVGGITESDLHLAETCQAVILAFNVRMSSSLSALTEKKGIIVKYFSVIYKLVDAVKDLMAGKLPPITEEVVQGHAEVKDAIRIPKIGVIAGSSVVDGKITRVSHLRLIRDNVVVHSGKLSSLRRFKDDVKEVQNGYECGISFENYTDIKVGDIIEAYAIKETPAKLDI